MLGLFMSYVSFNLDFQLIALCQDFVQFYAKLYNVKFFDKNFKRSPAILLQFYSVLPFFGKEDKETEKCFMDFENALE